MILRASMYHLKNGEMKEFFREEKQYDVLSMGMVIHKWYRKNKYAKRVGRKWICQDYRIDQQRPQRNVYSEAYLQVISMTELEEKHFDNLIKNIEKDIEYPTVWDNGEEVFYEKTIYCPNCGKRRKVLTSKTHCEFCGFEFSDSIECSECGGLNLKDSDVCRICGHDLNEESDDEEENYVMRCFNCHKEIEYGDKYCCNCGIKLKNVVECEYCGKEINEGSVYCNYCGRKR